MERVLNLIKDIDYGSILEYIKNHRIAVASTAAVVLYGAWYLKRPRNLPPGPWGYPIIGSLPVFFSVDNLVKMKEKYGDLSCLWFGGNRYWVFLNTTEAIKEAFVTRGDTFLDRDFQMSEIAGYENTIFSSPYNSSYKLNRRIAMQGLRSLISNRLAGILDIELNALEEALAANVGKPIDLAMHFKRTYANVIMTLLFDTRYQHADPALEDLLDNIDKWYNALLNVYAVELLPGFSKLLLYKQIAVMRKETDRLMVLFRENIERHLSTYDENKARDIVDHYIKEDSLENISIERLSHTCLSFYPDAIHTAHQMLLWCIKYMLNYPKYQERMLEEIRCNTAPSSRVTFTQRSKMPTTEAFILEVFRCLMLVVGVANKPFHDTTLRGYQIPSYVNVVANLAAVHGDPTLFPEPKTFNPDRYLKDGKLCNTENVIPFDAGKRMCIAEHFIKNELFYLFTNLMLKYDIKPKDGVPPSVVRPNTVDLSLEKYEVVLELRQEK